MTVAELISALQAMPQDAEVRIYDNDTEWLLPLHADDTVKLGEDGKVVIRAEEY